MFQEVRGTEVEVKKVGALGNWVSGIGRESGNAEDGVKGEGGEARWAGEGGVRNFRRGLVLCACHPPGLCGEDCGLAEEECAGGGCSGPGHCLCGGERHPWASGNSGQQEGAQQGPGLWRGALVVSGVSRWVSVLPPRLPSTPVSLSF